MDGLAVISTFASIIVIVGAGYAVWRKVDVRLVLGITALVLGGIAGEIAPIVREFLTTFSNERFVVPICCAMGFAYAMRKAECDVHLVRLLVKPIQRLRFFLIPGTILIGFVVNIPVISQTSTAVCLGAVIVPLLIAARFSSATIGATLLLGSSIGGELLNLGAPELLTVGGRLDLRPSQVRSEVIPLLLPHLMFSTILFWYFTIRHEKKIPPPESPVPPPQDSRSGETFRINYFKAAVPLLPLLLLTLASPPIDLFHVPERYLVPAPEAPAFAIGGPAFTMAKKHPAYETRLIGLAMLFGVAMVALSSPKTTWQLPKAFFEGAGYAFTEVVSLIVVASCFGKAIEIVGLAKLLTGVIIAVPDLLLPAAGIMPWAFATLSGSGMASTQALFAFFVPPAQESGVNPVEIGATVSVASALGRTMSPVAAVALMCGKLTGVDPFTLMKRVAPSLLISFTLVLLLRSLRII